MRGSIISSHTGRKVTIFHWAALCSSARPDIQTRQQPTPRQRCELTFAVRQVTSWRRTRARPLFLPQTNITHVCNRFIPVPVKRWVSWEGFILNSDSVLFVFFWCVTLCRFYILTDPWAAAAWKHPRASHTPSHPACTGTRANADAHWHSERGTREQHRPTFHSRSRGNPQKCFTVWLTHSTTTTGN